MISGGIRYIAWSFQLSFDLVVECFRPRRSHSWLLPKGTASTMLTSGPAQWCHDSLSHVIWRILLASSDRPDKRPITADDLFQIKLVSDPWLAPDGSRVAYVVTELNEESDAYTSAIWLLSLAGESPRRLTSGSHRDQSPRWSPDGSHIAFVSNRQGHTATREKSDEPSSGVSAEEKPQAQIWLIPTDGGEARQVTSVAHGASEPVWSPDGQSLAFLAKTKPADDLNAPSEPEAVADERVITSIRYRSDGSGFVETFPHVWSVRATGDDCRQLTSGPFEDGHPLWSPDGQTLYFISNRTDGNERNGRSLLYQVPASGGEPACATDGDYRFDSPVWSPDGKRIALLGTDDPVGGSSKNANLWTWTLATGELQNHSSDWDRSLGDYGMSDVSGSGDAVPQWSADGNSVYTLASDSGETHVYKIDLNTQQVHNVTEGARRIAAFQIIDEGSLVTLVGDAAQPFELFLEEPGGERALTSHNASFLNQVALSPAEELRCQSPVDGKEIQGWVLHPPGFDPDAQTKYPLIVQIHGGPHAMYGQAMFHEMQLMAARGYVVLFTNPRGSSGYGEEFTSCTRGTWGESDMPDVIAAVDALLARGFVDESRMGITGGSYGGYLTNWIIGHTDRFRAAVTQRCVSDFVSFYGTSDIGFTFGEYEFDGTPWEQHERLRRHSPITYVESITTPLLIIHSEQDLRCPIEQAEQLFTALKRLGRETVFVRIPNESHNLSRNGTPSRRLARLHHLLAWFDQHL